MSCHQGLSPQAPQAGRKIWRIYGQVESAALSPRTQFPLSWSQLPQSFLGDHSLPLSSPEVHIQPILPTQARSIEWFILDGQVTPSAPEIQGDFSGTVGIETLGSFPPDMNTGRPSADLWSMGRRAELRDRNRWVLMLLFEPLDPTIPEAFLYKN